MTRRDQVLEVIFRDAGKADERTAPQTLTQCGLAAEVGISRSNVSHVVNKMIRAGELRGVLRHVSGHQHRVKVYLPACASQITDRDPRPSTLNDVMRELSSIRLQNEAILDAVSAVCKGNGK